MYREEVRVINETGIHARPASLLIREASKYASDIRLVKGGQEYNTKSIIGVLSMGAVKGDVLSIEVEGHDEEAAVKALIDLINNQLRD